MTSARGAMAFSLQHLTGRTYRAGGQERARRMGALYAGIWLIFLYAPIMSLWQLPNLAVRWVGILSIAAFCVVYLRIFRLRDNRMFSDSRTHSDSALPGREAVTSLVGLAALGAVVVLTVGQDGIGTGIYLAVALVVLLPARLAVPLVMALAAGTEILSLTVDGWTDSLIWSIQICIAAFAVWGVTQLINRNVELLQAREENARLAVEGERNRLARDLHDILGHSLTVITIKAELAGRLLDIDPERVRAEVADLERLSRDALVDVRRAVDGYRELSLPGELARAREALRAAEIEGDLPTSAELVPSELRELFGWAVREGVTNVIRHSGARRCNITLTTASVEIQDNGVGCPVSAAGWGPGRGLGPGQRQGHGLLGLRERAEAVGAIIVTRSVEPHGFSLSVIAGGRR